MSTAVLSKNKWPFSPQTIPGLTLWLDAADTSSIVLSGTSVTQWKDKSGNGQNVLGYAGAIGQTTLNGNNALNFGSSIMYSPNFVWNSSFTQFFVAQVATGGIIINTQNPGVAYGDYVYTANGTLLNVNNYSTNVGIQFNDAVGAGVSPVPYNQWFMFCIGYDGVSTSAVNYTLNGTTRTTTLYYGSPVSVTNPALNLYINGVPSTNLGTGVLIAEIIHFNSSINTTQRQQVEGYLAQKWGLQTLLPTKHPYSSIYNTFNPTSVSGCKLWLDASDPFASGSLPLNGTTVSTWVDKSGSGNNATSAGSSVSTSYLGLGFGGSSVFTVNGLAGTLVNTPFVVFVVETFTGSSYGFLFGDDNVNSGGSYGYSLHIGYRNTTDLAFAMYGSDLEDTNISGTGNTRIWAFYLPSSSNRNTRRNGTVDAIFSNYNQLQAFTAPVIGRVFGGNYYNGYISEILVFNQDIGLTNIQQIEGYLANKWKLQSLLPSSHPYYSLTSNPFNPTSISGCQLWLDAADSTSVTLSSGTNVSAWKDKSGNANNISLTNGTVTYVNSNNLNFQSGGILQTSNYITITSGFSFIFIVCQATALSYSFGYALACSDIAGGDTSIRFVSSTTSLGNGNSNDIGYPSGYFVNGVLTGGSPVSIPSGYNIIGVLVNNSGSTRISLSSSFYGRYFVGNIQEVIIFNSLTTSQRQQFEGYLAWKWGLQTSLPSSHPYYSAPPGIPRPLYSRSFQPVDITGCQLWLDAYDLTTLYQNTGGTTKVTAAGQQVQFWGDKSGNGRNATSSDTAMTYNTSGLSVPSIYFSGSQTTGFQLSLPVTDVTYFFVINLTIPNSSYPYVYNSHNGTSHLKQNWQYNNASQMDYSGISGISSATNPAGLTVIMTRQDTSSTGLLAGWQNGTLMGTKSMGVTGETFTSFTLGTDNGGGTLPIIGYILETIVYNSVLSTSQRQQVEAYLAWKWKIRGSLPSTHPGYILPSYSTIFTPKSVSGLTLWLDAADSSSLVMSGSNVTTWIDKSGNGYNATSTGTPTVVSNGINRLQSVSLAGSSYFTGPISITGTSLTCFAVALTTRSMPNSSSDQRLVSLENTTNVDYGRTDGTIALFNQGGSGWIGTWRVSGPIAYNAITTNVPFLAVSEYDGTNGYLWYNGNAGTLASSSSSGTFGITKYGIGTQANPTIEYWNGTIAEIIIYNSALTTSQRQQVEGYLSWKWGLQSSLPSTHAFAKISP